MKAAVVANLPLFVRWPESIRELSILHICLVAPGALESALLRQPRASVNGQRIEFRPAGATPEQLRECEMVFVGVSDPATLFRAASALAGRPVLLVAEGSGVLQRGAAIGIAVQDGRVVLDVNLGALRREKFDVSAKLLRMARLVVD